MNQSGAAMRPGGGEGEGEGEEPEWENGAEAYQFGFLVPYVNLRSQMLKDFGHHQSKPPNWDRYMRFLDQVIESRGYDLEGLPEEFDINIFPLQLHFTSIPECPITKLRLESLLNFIVAKINEKAQMHGESYEYHGFVKSVIAISARCSFVTMTVKQGLQVKTVQALVGTHGYRNVYADHTLLEWSFKPT